MSQVAFLIYISDVTGSLSLLLGLCGFFGLVIGLIYWACRVAHMAQMAERGNKPTHLPAIPTRLWVALISSMTVAALLPSRETVLMMAGAETVVSAVTSEAGQEMLSEMQLTILHELRQMRGEVGAK